MSRSHVPWFVAGILVSALGCFAWVTWPGNAENAVSAAPDSPAAATPAPMEPAATPAAAAAPSFTTSDGAPRSWDEWASALTPDERRAADQLLLDYPEAYDLRSAAQLKWMVSVGFPTPADFAKASRLSYEELIRAGEAGDMKAAQLAYERALRESLEAGLDALANDPRLAAKRERALNALQGRTCSPFPLYVYARQSEHLVQHRGGEQSLSAWLQVLAAYTVIESLGDSRVGVGIQQMEREIRQPGMNTALARSAIALGRRAAPACRNPAFPAQ
jgi:hypothetical protein